MAEYRRETSVCACGRSIDLWTEVGVDDPRLWRHYKDGELPEAPRCAKAQPIKEGVS